MRRVRGLELAQPGVEGGVRHELAGAAVVRVPVVGVRRQDDPRLLAADDVDDGELLLAAAAQPAVAEVERFAELGAEDLGRPRGLLAADLGGAARAHLAARQVHDAEAVARGLQARERAAARQLDVVRVRGDREDVNGHGRLLRNRGRGR